MKHSSSFHAIFFAILVLSELWTPVYHRVSAEPQIFSDRSYQKTINGVSHNMHTASIRFTPDDVDNPFAFTIVNPSTGAFVRNVSFTLRQPTFIYSYNLIGYIPRGVFPAVHTLNLVPIGGQQTSTLDNYYNATTLHPVTGDDQGTGFQLQTKLPPGRRLSKSQKDTLSGHIRHKNELYNRAASGFHVNHHRETSPLRSSTKALTRVGDKYHRNSKPPHYTQGRAHGHHGRFYAQDFWSDHGTDFDGNEAARITGAAAGIGAGFAIGGVWGAAIGGIVGFFLDDGDASKWRALETELKDVNKTSHDALDFATLSLSEFGALNSSVSQTIEGFTDVKQTVNNLFSRVEELVVQTDTLNSVVNQMQRNFTIEFNQTYQDIVAAVNTTDALRNITFSMWNVTERHIRQLYNSILTVERASEDLSLTVYNAYRDLPMRRALIQMIFRHLNDSLPLSAAPFVRDIGIPPMSVEERANYSTLENALVVSAVHMQWTAQDPLNSNKYTAYDTRVTFRCDSEWLLNNTIPGISFKTLFSYIGPADLSNTTRCFPYNTTNQSTQWTCHCVIVIEKTHCELNNQTGTKLFPFSWNATVSLEASTSLTDICATSVQSETVDPSTTDISTISFVTDPDTWNSWFEAQCEASTDFIAVPGVNGSKLRLTTETIGIYTDLVMNLTDPTVPNPCEPSFATLFSSDNNLERLSFNVYQLWRQAYALSVNVLLPRAETLLFGSLMTDVVPVNNMADRRPDSSQSYRSVEAAYVSISDDKLPVYAVAPIGLDHEVLITLTDSDGNDQVLTATAGQFNFSVPVDDFVGNFTWSSNVDLSVAFSQIFPPAVTYIVGDLFEEDGVTKSSIIYDVPWSRVCTGVTATARAGCVNYIFQNASAGPTAPITLLDWLEQYKQPFDPYAAFETAMYYAREHVVTEGIGTTCGLRVPADGNLSAVTNNSLSDFDWCALFNFADVEAEPLDPHIIYLNPRQFSVTGTFEIPAGQIVEQVLSACPSSYNITRSPGTQSAVLCLSADQPGPTTATVVTRSATIACAQTYPVTYWRAHNSCTLIPACGLQYVNVFPDGADGPCYPSPGLLVTVDQISPSQSALTPAIANYIDTGLDLTTAALVSIANEFAALRGGLALLPLSTASVDALIDQFNDQIDQFRQRLDNQSAIFENTSQSDLWNQTLTEVDQQLQQILANLIDQQQKFNDTMTDLITRMTANYLDNILPGLANLSAIRRQWLIDLAKQDEDLQKLHDAIDSSNANCDDSVPLLGPVICGIANIFGGFGEGWLSWIFHLLLYIVIIGLIICCCIQLGPTICAKCFSGGNSLFKKAADKLKNSGSASSEAGAAATAGAGEAGGATAVTPTPVAPVSGRMSRGGRAYPVYSPLREEGPTFWDANGGGADEWRE